MHLLIAPNSFKNSLNAILCAEAIKEGLVQSSLNCTCTCFPVGDGGDGTASLLIQKWNADKINVTVHDPLKKIITASFGFIEKRETAIIEMADASGIKLLSAHELNPLHATSFGTGELILEALNKNSKKIIVCIGGSATVDGGAGILQALGFRFLNSDNKELTELPKQMGNLSKIDIANADKRILSTEIIILCDVNNYVLGDDGAAKIFGPQKGATANDIEKLENALAQFSNVTLQQTGIDMNSIKHGGAAGGVAAGLYAWLNARLVNGIEYFLDVANFSEALENADIVITGEGSIDAQTLKGKAPYGVAKRAKEKNIPVIALAGKVPLHNDDALNKLFDILIPINNETDLSKAVLHTKENLIRTAKMLGDLLALKN